MEINSGDVVIYIGDKPIAVTTSATFTIPDEMQRESVLAPAVKEWVVEGLMKWPELTRKQMLEMEWLRAARLPRKQKKQYRKKIRSAYIAELHRDKVTEFLSMI